MPENGKPYVTALYPEQHDQAADSLGRAFINDPTFKSIVPDITDPAERAKRLPDLFRAMLAIERRNGQPVFGVIDDNGRVVAAAMTEGVGHPGTLGLLATGLGQMPRLIGAIGWGGLYRALTLFSILADNHPKEPHLYLQVLGCDPPFQGKGYGKALLDRLALEAKARPEIAGVYLETATEANVAFYSSKGYKILGELYPLGVRTWRMYQRKRQG
ncbi:MAG TPA: GNAT family N-acetyltransferase [Candidatus Binatus sp.]|uniref:GNAT family N-acetyltransferase n=1 Tax=Candidatus Binatus sp. TaxID=2811406 RepID=UPI002B46F63E|nr:GNAT family N-acetyltransferase [Candidatus Binatus sp.]HKN13968.1 GNAT family N-acetyltransferase [Candidatus Binatus sp.]